ncbi:DUF397 domain-containing protein [Streptomyces sp. NPDC096310]|uniref:DUF397 domain-containing protein n=1 Tax=Streptomyces sp. NPDC096310 TaxID=3366082 RepID=UPI003806DE5A
MSDSNWQISSYCQAGNSCVSVRRTEADVQVRESEQPDEAISATPDTFRALILGVKTGTFDDLIQRTRPLPHPGTEARTGHLRTVPQNHSL